MKLLKPISCLLVAATFFISCENENFDTETNNFESDLQSFLEDNLLTAESRIITNNGTINIGDIDNNSELSRAKSLLDEAYSITIDENDIYIYDEQTTLQYENDESLELSTLETSDKASNPVFYTFTIYSGKNFTGKRHKFTFRKNKARSLRNGVQNVNLRRFRGGSFDRRISSARGQFTKAGQNFKKNNAIYALVSTKRDNFDDFLGAIGVGRGKNSVNIKDLDGLRFTQDEGFRDPRGVDRFFETRKWDDKIRWIQFITDLN